MNCGTPPVGSVTFGLEDDRRSELPMSTQMETSVDISYTQKEAESNAPSGINHAQSENPYRQPKH